MKPKAIYYFIIVLLVTGMIACGADDDDSEPDDEKTPTTSSQPAEPTVVVERNIDFAAAELAIRDLYAVYVTAHGDQDVDVLADVWLKSEAEDVFTAWTFWAGTFRKTLDGRQ